MLVFTPFFAYIGPETLLPMTSIVATVVGFALVLGRSTLRLLFIALKTIVVRPFKAIIPKPAANILKKPNILKRRTAGAESIHASTKD